MMSQNTQSSAVYNPKTRTLELTLIIGEHVPAFKNTKMLARGRMITDPRKQFVMQKLTDCIVSAMYSLSVITEDGTETEQRQRQAIASLLPSDDCRQCISECAGWKWEKVRKGFEGVRVKIEQID